MAIVGKIHELSFYGLISNLLLICNGKISLNDLISAAFHVVNFKTFFLAYLFWATVLFIPIAVVGGFATKYGDGGQGLTFGSDNIVVIIFAHIGEEEDKVFDTEEAAEEYALYLCSCARTGAETLHMSNPGDYDYDEDNFEDPDYEIVEED